MFYIISNPIICMDCWGIITFLGLPEAWSAISLAMVLAYIMLIHTSWAKPSPERRAFKAAAVLMALTLILAFFSVRAIKETTQIPRSCIPCPAEDCNPYCIENDFSFPSGHAATIFAVCTAAYLLLRRRSGLLLYIPAALIAYSRVALGVHTPADAAAGSAIGILSCLVIWKLQPRMGILSTLKDKKR